MAGCELEDGHPISPVGVQKTLQYSTDGLLQLIYNGERDDSTGSHTDAAPHLHRRGLGFSHWKCSLSLCTSNSGHLHYKFRLRP